MKTERNKPFHYELFLQEEGYSLSRSYKKYPIFQVDKGGAKWAKAKANRRFRRCCKSDDIHGKSALYRRHYESWNIHDDFYRWSKIDAEKSWKLEESLLVHGITDPHRTYYHRRFKTKRRFMNYWEKRAIRK